MSGSDIKTWAAHFQLQGIGITYTMFKDCRSKRIVFAAHCILNQNSISDGTAVFPGACKEVVELLMASHVGIVQMPCPELMCLGLDRGNPRGSSFPVVEENTRIRACLGTNAVDFRIKQMVQDLVNQIREYKKHKFQIVGIIGINRSPSCGVDTTSDNNMEIKGKGIFMDALTSALDKRQILVQVIGIKPSETPETARAVKGLLANP